jgi:hypothetical protein
VIRLGNTTNVTMTTCEGLLWVAGYFGTGCPPTLAVVRECVAKAIRCRIAGLIRNKVVVACLTPSSFKMRKEVKKAVKN